MLENERFRRDLMEWYGRNRRLLPWRGDIVDDIVPPPVTSYGIWISEIMLQQTRVETVIAYWRKWMTSFPTIEILSRATQEEINSHWAGLGYYRRAQAILKCSKILVEQYNSQIPSDYNDLLNLPGIGPYTAGAISSIAHNQPIPAVDGNVIRVFSRLYALEEEGPQLEKKCRAIGQELVDVDSPGIFNQALMELGAMICKPTKPTCETCPVNDHCLAYQQHLSLSQSSSQSSSSSPSSIPSSSSLGDIEDLSSSPKSVTYYPKKTPKKPPVDHKFITIALVHPSHPEKYLFSRRPASGLLAHQWEFPCHEISFEEEPGPDTWKDAINSIESSLQISSSVIQILNTHDLPLVHIFSHQRHHLHIVEAVLPVNALELITASQESVQWMTYEELSVKGITTGVKKIFTQLKKTSTQKNQSEKLTKTKRARGGVPEKGKEEEKDNDQHTGPQHKEKKTKRAKS